MINAGKYRFKIKIIQEYLEKDADGFNQQTPQIVLTTWAQVNTTKGMTLIANGTDFEKAYTRFVIRYPVTEITRKMFVIFKGNKYSIEYINNIDSRNIELELQCKEVKH